MPRASASRSSAAGVLRGVGVELRLAHRRAEVVGLTLVLALPRHRLLVDGHSAHRIFHHARTSNLEPRTSDLGLCRLRQAGVGDTRAQLANALLHLRWKDAREA